MTIVTSFCGLCLLLFLGKMLRMKITLLQRLYLPSSVIGGILGLITIQLWPLVSGNSFPASWVAGWSALPGFLINLVFAGLFIGMTVPSLGKIWKTAGPQLAYGQIVAWGQYTVGLGITMLLLGPLFGVKDIFGTIIPIGFEGGHGTAGGLIPTFNQLGWSEGVDFGLASATMGMISGIVCGMALINWAVRRGYVSEVKSFDEQSHYEKTGVYRLEKRPPAGKQTVYPDSIDSLALHLAVLGLAVLIGYGIRELMVWVNDFLPESVRQIGILTSFPLFPLCMIGGLLLQLTISRIKTFQLIDHTLMQRLAGTALDFLVVSAISMIRIEVIVSQMIPLLILVVCGILWNLFCVLWLARRILPDFWFERSIAEMGQSMGVTATGLLLLRTVDPESKTEAPAAFGYKQLLHEPFMGGGLWTSAALPLVAYYGGWLVFCISVVAIGTWLMIWRLLWGGRGNSR